MLIESYDLQIEVSDHTSMEFEYEATAHFAVDISQVFPYLNATLKNGTFFADVPAFSWRQDNHKIGFWQNRIAVDHLESRESAKEKIEHLVGLVNDVWEKRGEIPPDTGTRENLQPLELYRLLPNTNCKECGESSCFNFALKLAAGQIELSRCGPAAKDEHMDQRAKLEDLLEKKRPLI